MLPGAAGRATAPGRGSCPAAPHILSIDAGIAQLRGAFRNVDGDLARSPACVKERTGPHSGTRRDHGPRVGSGATIASPVQNAIDDLRRRNAEMV